MTLLQENNSCTNDNMRNLLSVFCLFYISHNKHILNKMAEAENCYFRSTDTLFTLLKW